VMNSRTMVHGVTAPTSSTNKQRMHTTDQIVSIHNVQHEQRTKTHSQ